MKRILYMNSGNPYVEAVHLTDGIYPSIKEFTKKYPFAMCAVFATPAQIKNAEKLYSTHDSELSKVVSSVESSPEAKRVVYRYTHSNDFGTTSLHTTDDAYTYEDFIRKCPQVEFVSFQGEEGTKEPHTLILNATPPVEDDSRKYIMEYPSGLRLTATDKDMIVTIHDNMLRQKLIVPSSMNQAAWDVIIHTTWWNFSEPLTLLEHQIDHMYRIGSKRKTDFIRTYND